MTTGGSNEATYLRVFVELSQAGFGTVSFVSVLSGGSGFTRAPTVTLSGGNGGGATAEAEISEGSVSRIRVTGVGAGYGRANPPNVTIVPHPDDATRAGGVVAQAWVREGSSTEITPWIREESVSIQETLGRTINTFSCELEENSAGVIPFALSDYGAADIRVTYAIVPYPMPSRADEQRIVFAGIIASVDVTTEGLRTKVTLSAQDYTVLLTKAYIPRFKYTSADFPTDKHLIRHWFANAFRSPLDSNEVTATVLESQDVREITGFDVETYVQTGLAAPEMQVNRMELAQALDQLAGNSGFEWYIDYEQRLHYYAHFESWRRSPIRLNDVVSDMDNAVYSDFSFSNDSVGVANVIEIIGAQTTAPETDNLNNLIRCDGVRTEYNADRHWQAPEGEALPVMRLFEPGGTNIIGDVATWRRLLIATQGSNRADEADVVWNLGEQLLIFNTPPANGALIYIRGTYAYRITHIEVAQDSYNRLGRWFREKIVDEEIRTEEQAIMRARREIGDKKFGVETISLVVNYPRVLDGSNALDWRTPLKTGQVVAFSKQLSSAHPGAALPGSPRAETGSFVAASGDYIVERLDTTFLGGGLRTYSATIRIPYFFKEAETEQRLLETDNGG